MKNFETIKAKYNGEILHNRITYVVLWALSVSLIEVAAEFAKYLLVTFG